MFGDEHKSQQSPLNENCFLDRPANRLNVERIVAKLVGFAPTMAVTLELQSTCNRCRSAEQNWAGSSLQRSNLQRSICEKAKWNELDRLALELARR